MDSAHCLACFRVGMFAVVLSAIAVMASGVDGVVLADPNDGSSKSGPQNQADANKGSPGDSSGKPDDESKTPPTDSSDETGASVPGGNTSGELEAGGFEMSVDQSSANESTSEQGASASADTAGYGDALPLWDEVLQYFGQQEPGKTIPDLEAVDAAAPMGPSLTPDEEASAITNGWQ